MANDLLRLVLIGKRRATSSSLLGYEREGENLLKIGDLSIVIGGDKVPRCVLKTTNATLIDHQ